MFDCSEMAKESEKAKKVFEFTPFECLAGKHADFQQVWITFRHASKDDYRAKRPWCDGCLLDDSLAVDTIVDSFMARYNILPVCRGYVYSSIMLAREEIWDDLLIYSFDNSV